MQPSTELSEVTALLTDKAVDLKTLDPAVVRYIHALYVTGWRAFHRYRRTNQLFWMSVACNVVLLALLWLR